MAPHIINDGSSLYNIAFDSWSDWLDYAEHAPCEIPPDQRASLCPSDRDLKWTGGADFDYALILARKGWPEGAARARERYAALWDKLSRLIDVIEPRYVMAPEYYGILDVARVCEGEPEHWLEFDTRRVAGEGTRYVHVAVNIAASSYVSGAVQATRAIAIAAMIDALEMTGVRVRLTILDGTRNNPATVTALQLVQVKDYDEYLDLDQLVFACGHPACLRRLGFATMERYPRWVRRALYVPGDYGVPAGPPADARPWDVYIGCLHAADPTWASEQATLAWVVARLREQGVVLHEDVARTAQHWRYDARERKS